jgi:hypothetical protein
MYRGNATSQHVSWICDVSRGFPAIQAAGPLALQERGRAIAVTVGIGTRGGLSAPAASGPGGGAPRCELVAGADAWISHLTNLRSASTPRSRRAKWCSSHAS